MREVEEEIVSLGYQIIALSPDTPANLQPTVAKNELGYQLVSDASMSAAKGFGIAFKMADKAVEQYKGYGIDLEKASGEAHHLLPVPAVFVIDEEGKVKFQYVNPDYRIRIPGNLVLEAARAF